MLINVTQEHIEDGFPCQATHCPVAFALKDAGFEDVVVGYCGNIYIDGENRGQYDIVQEFVQDFDDDRPVKPFSFELEEW